MNYLCRGVSYLPKSEAETDNTDRTVLSEFAKVWEHYTNEDLGRVWKDFELNIITQYWFMM